MAFAPALRAFSPSMWRGTPSFRRLQQIGILIGLVQGAIRRVETKAPKRYVRLSWDMSHRRRGKAKPRAGMQPLARQVPKPDAPVRTIDWLVSPADCHVPERNWQL